MSAVDAVTLSRLLSEHRMARDFSGNCMICLAQPCHMETLAADLRNLRATLAAVLTFADDLDAGASLRWTGDVAKELRGVLGGGS